ncbi:hypothetical protein FOBRF1_006094 [Fusarium oxysporum]
MGVTEDVHRRFAPRWISVSTQLVQLPLSYPPWAPGSKIPESDPQPTRVLVLTLPFLLPDAIHFNFT